MKKNVTQLFIHFKQVYNCYSFYDSCEFLQENLLVFDDKSLTRPNIEIISNYIF